MRIDFGFKGARSVGELSALYDVKVVISCVATSMTLSSNCSSYVEMRYA